MLMTLALRGHRLRSSWHTVLASCGSSNRFWRVWSVDQTFPVCDIHKLSDHVMQPDAGPEPGSDLRNQAGGRLRLKFYPPVAGCCGWWLGGEAFAGEPLVRCRVRDIRRRSGSFFLDLGE